MKSSDPVYDFFNPSFGPGKVGDVLQKMKIRSTKELLAFYRNRFEPSEQVHSSEHIEDGKPH